MKLGAFYTVFDGIELIARSVENIIPFCERIVICYQTVSNKGEKNPNLRKELEFVRIHNKEHADKISFLEYEPRLDLNIKEIERRKHNLAIQYLKAEGMTHYLGMAVDHFYDPGEFLRAKVKALEYDVTLTSMYTYFKKPEWQLTPIEQYQAPFICRLYLNTEISKLEYPGYRTDPSVRINTRNKLYCFTQREIMLHHYSMIRKDINKKFRNAALFRTDPDLLKKYEDEWNNYDLESNPGVTYFGGRKIKVVPDYFQINRVML